MSDAPPPLFFFGGTFDPPHAGHAAIVRRLLALHGNARVIVSPAPQAPLREAGHLFSYRERFWLLRRMFAAEIAANTVVLSVLERTLPRPSYTINTLAALTAICGRKPVVVMGADQAQNLMRWHRARDLVHDYEFIFFARGEIAIAGETGVRYRTVTDFDEPVSATALRASLAALPVAQRLQRALELSTQQKEH